MRSPRRWSGGGWPCWPTASPRCCCAACRRGEAVRRAVHAPALCAPGCSVRSWSCAPAVASCAARVSSAGAPSRHGSRARLPCMLLVLQLLLADVLAAMQRAERQRACMPQPLSRPGAGGQAGGMPKQTPGSAAPRSRPSSSARRRPRAHAGRHRVPGRPDAGRAAGVQSVRPAPARQRARSRHAPHIHRAALGVAAHRGAGARARGAGATGRACERQCSGSRMHWPPAQAAPWHAGMHAWATGCSTSCVSDIFHCDPCAAEPVCFSLA